MNRLLTLIFSVMLLVCFGCSSEPSEQTKENVSGPAHSSVVNQHKITGQAEHADKVAGTDIGHAKEATGTKAEEVGKEEHPAENSRGVALDKHAEEVKKNLEEMAEEAAHSAADAVNPGEEQLNHEIQKTGETASDAAKDAVDAVKDTVSQVKESADQGMENAKAVATEKADEAAAEAASGNGVTPPVGDNSH